MAAEASSRVVAAFLMVTVPMAAVPAAAQTDVYAGKKLTMLVGNDPGGGFDAYARLFARHLPRLIPGSPTFVVQNMPGAGSAIAANYLYNVAPQDGSYIGAVTPGAIVAPMLEDHASLTYDPSKFNYLGSADAGSRVCMTYQSSKTKTAEDALTTKTVMGAAGAGSSSRDYALLHKNTTNLKFEVVTGYKGTADILIAMERGEIDGVCGIDWSSVKSSRPSWVADKKLNYLFQVGVQPNAELDGMGVPQAAKYTKSEEDRTVMEFVTAQQMFARPYLLGPNVPKAQVAVLRAAFNKLVEDPQLLAEAGRLSMLLAPASGEKVQELITRMYAAPKAIVERARAAVRQ
jgi:tripartite-type tricarboxylate transporter receptor subunit TctC